MFRFGINLIAINLILAPTLGKAASFTPDQTSIVRIAHRFRTALDSSGINGVGQDVLKCYQDNLNRPEDLKLCVVYDWSALRVDRMMIQYFTGHGAKAEPAHLFTNEAIDARMHTYGEIAFHGDPQAMRTVGEVVTKVVNAAMPAK